MQVYIPNDSEGHIPMQEEESHESRKVREAQNRYVKKKYWGIYLEWKLVGHAQLLCQEKVWVSVACFLQFMVF